MSNNLDSHYSPLHRRGNQSMAQPRSAQNSRLASPQPVQTEAIAPTGIHATAKVHNTAMVEKDVSLGKGTSVWDNAHIRHGARLGEACIVGGKSYIAYDVRIGNRVKINAFAYICNGVTIEDGVMISAGTIFTNDRFPRAATPDLKSLHSSDPDEHTRPTWVREGATLGAHCTIGNDLEIGRFAMVGMGSVVTKSIPDFHMAYGVPARSVGAVCRCGEPLMRFPEVGTFETAVSCQRCGLTYHIKNGVVSEWTPPSKGT